MSVTITFQGAQEELEMNLSNCNFFAFFKKIGIEADYCGEEKAEVLYNLCKSFNPKALVQNAYAEGNYYDCGRSLEQVSRYKWNLMTLASEAMKQNKSIVWY